jgi:hypothetical protein
MHRAQIGKTGTTNTTEDQEEREKPHEHHFAKRFSSPGRGPLLSHLERHLWWRLSTFNPWSRNTSKMCGVARLRI